MSVCFSINLGKVEDDCGNVVEWKSSDGGANRPQNIRPLSIYPEKEEKGLLVEFVPLVEREVEEINKNGVPININNRKLSASCEHSELTMIDGKMVSKLLQVEGAYCTMCTYSESDCHRRDVVETGFAINRSISSIKDLALSLADQDTGEIPRKKGDYSVRQGIIDQPITKSDITKHIPVCHSKIRSFSWFVELLVRLLSHRKWHSVTHPVRYTQEDKDKYKSATAFVKDIFNKKLGINIGNPGDLVEGNAFRDFSSDYARGVIIDLVEEDLKEGLKEIHLGLCTAVKVINSQKRKADVEKF